MSMRRLCIVQAIAQDRGGPVDHAVDVAVGLVGRGFDSHVIEPVTEHTARAERAGVIWHRLEIASKRALRGAADATRRLLLRLRTDVVLEAVAAMPGVRLLPAGDRTLGDSVRRRVARDDLSAKVEVLGHVAEPAVGGVPDVISPGIDGLLCVPEEVDACAAAFLRLCDEPAGRTVMGRAAREGILGGYTLDHCLDGRLESYRRAGASVS